ncbi:MAG: hypothetical protein IAI49_12540 [Candidatus Eremiobacteraeota bacterium]|nr:hypothetical protein [Candidatus Eremiobacteraeota bacterium]
MYCQDTGNAATGHIAHLPRTYYAGKTRITDRSLAMLEHIDSLEHIELRQCDGLTDAGIDRIAKLPRLRDVDLDGLPNVTRHATTLFSERVRVRYSE